jgi:signal transduction histidine kinase
MRPIRSVRTRLLLVVVTAVTLALTAATIGFNLLIASSTDGTETSTLRQRAHDERELMRIVNGAPAPTERASDPLGDTRIWIFAGNKAIEAPRAHPTTALVARMLAHGPSRFVTISSTDERLFSLPIVDQGRRVGTIVTGISLSPYEQTRRSALVASLAFAATVLGIAVAAAAWLLRSALRPVATMTQQAETWSEQDLDRRFGFDDPHDELTRLGFTLDRLLDRIAASLRHERRFSAELSHELRTPLAKLTAETELALRRPRTSDEYRRALGEIHDHALQLARIVDALLAAARQEASPLGIADAVAVARAAADVCQPLADDLGVELDVAEDAPTVRVGVDPDLAERILHPVLDNACRYARAHVQVSLARSDGVVVFSVSDDGPGVGADEAESIFEPATRGEAGRRTGPSAGLGLALARRLARSASGDVEAEPSAAGGRFSIRLPAA